MRLNPRTTRHPASRYEPRLEWLESRHLLTASAGAGYGDPGAIEPNLLADLGSGSSAADLTTLHVVQTTPGNGSILDQSPQGLDIVFNLPIYTFFITSDIGLVRVDDAGNVVEDLSNELEPLLDRPDPSPLLHVDLHTTLQPGRYQIILLGSSGLSGVGPDGQTNIPLDNDGMDKVIASFTIVKPDPADRLTDATDLGTIGGPVPLVTPGTLDLSRNSGNYQLYKFTLAPGHLWRLGAEISAQRDQSPLRAALALFDSQGRLIKTGQLGRGDASADPYLFAGLRAGTYYLGISGNFNLPGTPGGYDPVAGQFGTVDASQPGGDYQLHLKADPADTPTSVLSAQPFSSDPLDPRPTGIVVVFSGPLDLSSFKATIGADGFAQFAGLQVVDQSGRAWSLSLTSYDERNCQLTFLFDSPLPNGRYTLRLPTQGGVTDLSGQFPVANPQQRGQGTGQGPEQHLASWTVSNRPVSHNANDLGTILRDASGSGTLGVGQSASYRFVVPIGGLLTLQAGASKGLLLIQIFGADGTTPLHSSFGETFNSSTIHLTPGVYTIRTKAVGASPVKFNFTLARNFVQPESVYDNGVGQGPALNLTLITPTPIFTSGSPSALLPPLTSNPSGPAPWQGSPGGSGGGGTPQNPPSQLPNPGVPGTASGGATAIATSGLVLTLGGGLVGTPVAEAEHVAAVGPATRSGGTALAANATGVLQGINYGRSIPRGASNLSGESLLETSDLTLDPQSVVNLLPTGSRPVVVKRAQRESTEEQREIAQSSDWLGGIGATLLHWLTPASPTPSDEGPLSSESTLAVAPPPVQTRTPADDSATEVSESNVENADLTAPLGLSVVAVLALRLHRPVRRWWKQRKSQGAGRRRATV